jgi:hypothetical protein
MIVYEPMVANGYEWINFVDRGYYRRIREFDGEPRAATWTPPTAVLVTDDEGRKFRASDFPWLGKHALVMRRSAVDALKDMLSVNSEILPLQTNDGVELFLLNTRTIDALDESRSTWETVPKTDRVMRFLEVSFMPSAIQGIDLFRLPHSASPTYVSGRFVERVQTAGLRGLVFREVWAG